MTATITPSRLGGRRLLATLAAAALAATASAIVISRVLRAVSPEWAADPDRLAVVIVAAVYLCVTVALLLGLGKNNEQRRAWLGVDRLTPWSVKFGLVAWAGAYAAAAALYAATAPFGITPSDAVEVLWGVGSDNGRLSDASPALMALILARVCLLVPLAEELLFRGALFTWLRARFPAPGTILLTAAAFALIHQTPVMMPLAVMVGIGAGLIRERTGSVTVPIALHAVQNGIVVALSFLATGWHASLPL